MADSKACQNTQAPVRVLASPRPTPPSSSSGFDSASPDEEPYETHSSPSSGRQSPLRGRTSHRIPPQCRLVSCAFTRRYNNLDSTPIKWEQRSVDHSLTYAPLEPDHSILEPLPLDRFRTSLSEELYRASTFDSNIDLGAFCGHRDTLGLLQLRNLHNPCTRLPSTFFTRISIFLDLETFKALRLTCHSWSVAISQARPIIIPSVIMLPTKVLEEIYLLLSPIDFNAARHTCRAWMRASLEPRLLTVILKRGGWFETIAADLQTISNQESSRRTIFGNDEWILSKRLATECSLRPGWLGHGMEEVQSTITGLRLTSQVDLSQLRNDKSQRSKTYHASTQFTVSACSNFLLVTESRTIYIYALRRIPFDSCTQPYGGYFEFVTSIVCPDHVLATSMDTSCQRYAVAAIIHGSTGIVHNLDLATNSAQFMDMDVPRSRFGIYDDTEGSSCIPPLSRMCQSEKSPCCTPTTCGRRYNGPRISQNGEGSAGSTVSPFCSDAFGSRNETCSEGFYPLQPIEDTFRAYASKTQAEVRSCTIFRNLCSFDDPPRSVAICPQSRCVAFGSQRGIELYWTDAVTGQALNRWFSLSTPADHLFFMPVKNDVDYTGNFRLVSSTASPEFGILTKRSPGSIVYSSSNDSDDRAHGIISHNVNNSATFALLEYCRAVPLSDGRHLLVTIRGDGGLCLVAKGSPSTAPKKMIKRFSFVGPTTSEGKMIQPHTYSVAAELQWGVRIVAAYENRLWLFVVPPDMFFSRKSTNKRANRVFPREDQMPIPTTIEGVEIARIENLTSLCLDGSAGDLTVWAFSSDAKASIFQLTGGHLKAVTQRIALKDGTIVLVRDADGDTVMLDAPNCPDDDTVGPYRTTSASSAWLSRVPCFPSCSHRYCKFLQYSDNGTFPIESIGPPSFAANSSKTKSDVSISPCPRMSLESSLAPAFHSALPDDEGYASERDVEPENTRFAMEVPPLAIADPWNEVDARWVPEHLSYAEVVNEDEGLGLDVIELCRCECEFAGDRAEQAFLESRSLR